MAVEYFELKILGFLYKPYWDTFLLLLLLDIAFYLIQIRAFILFFSLSDLLVDMLGVLASYNLTVRELKFFFSKLQGEKGKWVNNFVIVLVILSYYFLLAKRLTFVIFF